MRSGYTYFMNVATSSERTTVGVRELKNQLSSVLDRVKAGEEITVTEHGRPVARLTGVGGDIDRMTELVTAGVIHPAAVQRRRLPMKRVKIVDGSTFIADTVAEHRG